MTKKLRLRRRTIYIGAGITAFVMIVMATSAVGAFIISTHYARTSSPVNPSPIVVTPTEQNAMQITPTGSDLSNAPDNNNFDSNYDFPPVTQKKGTVRIPVLTYHHVAPLPKNNTRDYFVSPTVFAEQMEYLKQKNYKVLTPEQFFDILKSGKNPTQKSVLITFDDGNQDNYIYAFPILKQYGYTGMFNVVTDKLGIKPAQLKEMSDAGMSIESHSAQHMGMQVITDPAILHHEVVDSKYRIESITGKKVNVFVYPGCGYNTPTVSAVAAASYLMAFSCGKEIDNSSRSKFALSRVHIYNDMGYFAKILSGIWEYPTYSD